jgi:hypothetical protein
MAVTLLIVAMILFAGIIETQLKIECKIRQETHKKIRSRTRSRCLLDDLKVLSKNETR